jgi:tRNA (guanine37-N1)-methyltransferase
MSKEKASAIEVDKREAQSAIRLLDENELRLKHLKPKRDGEKVIVPCEKGKAVEKLLKKKKFKWVSKLFEKQPQKVKSLKEALKEKLSSKELEQVITFYNVLGDIAVLEIPDSLKKKEKLIAKTLLESVPTLKTVVKKSGITQGKYRVHPVKVLAGKKNTIACYKESGCCFKVSLGKVFFSPRLGKERLRISKLIKKGEVVAALFAGVGPFPIVFAKNSKMAHAHAVELNPDAVKEMEENIRLNKVGGKITSIKGDVKKVVPALLKGLCDRAVMPLPKSAETFLREAIQTIKPEGGVVHFYHFAEKETAFKQAVDFIKAACKKEKRTCRILRKERVRDFSPKIMQVVVDFKVK